MTTAGTQARFWKVELSLDDQSREPDWEGDFVTEELAEEAAKAFRDAGLGTSPYESLTIYGITPSAAVPTVAVWWEIALPSTGLAGRWKLSGSGHAHRRWEVNPAEGRVPTLAVEITADESFTHFRGLDKAAVEAAYRSAESEAAAEAGS